MTTRQYRSLARYIFSIAKDFGLRDWELTLASDPPDSPSAIASFEAVYGRKRGIVRVSEGFEHESPEDQRNAILHELVHAHTAPAREYINRTLPSILGAAAWATFDAAYEQANEFSVDAIAAAIADRYPLWVP